MVMAETMARRENVVAKVPALNIANKFGKYKSESELMVRKAGVVEDQTLKQLKEAWKACPYNMRPGKNYATMLQTIKALEYSAKDVENFTIALAEFQAEDGFSSKAGYFLSALINSCTDSQFIIHTNHLAERINNLGYRNTKHITVDGHAGDDVGTCMLGGTITVKGHAGDDVGYSLEGGAIMVKGNAGRQMGQYMMCGTITVEGTAGNWVGLVTEGGTITVRGKRSEMLGYSMFGGTITAEGNSFPAGFGN